MQHTVCDKFGVQCAFYDMQCVLFEKCAVCFVQSVVNTVQCVMRVVCSEVALVLWVEAGIRISLGRSHQLLRFLHCFTHTNPPTHNQGISLGSKPLTQVRFDQFSQ